MRGESFLLSVDEIHTIFMVCGDDDNRFPLIFILNLIPQVTIVNTGACKPVLIFISGVFLSVLLLGLRKTRNC